MPTTNPTRSYNMTTKYHPPSSKLVMLNSGCYPTSNDYLMNTYTWNGSDWTLFTGTNPPARIDADMAFDGNGGSNKIILFGGRGAPGVGYLNDTWSWNGSVWAKLTPANKPCGRAKHLVSKLFNASGFGGTQGLLLFGGENDLNLFNDTWVWNHTNWVNANISGPPGRIGGAIASRDPYVTLFGGANTSFLMNDTWRFDSNSIAWQKMNTGNSPSARYDHSMTFNASGGYYLLFGGRDYGNILNDTWYMSDSDFQWHKLNPAHSPCARFGAQITYDPNDGNVYLFGGRTETQVLNDTWMYNDGSGDWVQL